MSEATVGLFRVLAVCAAVALGACQSSIVSETGPLMVQSVNVTKGPEFAPVSDVAGKITTGLERGVVGRDVGGTPATIDVELDKINYKNPAMALLIGSSNQITSNVTIRNAQSGETISQFQHLQLEDVAFQGVIGATQAIIQDRQKVDAKLAQSYSTGLERRIFGKEPAKRASPVPVRVDPDADTEPAPAGQPVS